MKNNFIRSMRESDIDVLMELWLTSNISAHYFITQNYWIEKYDEVRNQYFPKSVTYVYEENNVILGFISLINNLVGFICTANSARNKGIGSVLIDKAKSISMTLELNVWANNEEAVLFYSKNGFKILDKHINYDFLEYTMIWSK